MAKTSAHALTVAVAAAATAATEEDTTGSQPQFQDQEPAKQPAQKGPGTRDHRQLHPNPHPHHNLCRQNAEPPLSDRDEDEESA